MYDWDGKEDICRRLWVDEKKTLAQLSAYMKEHYNFEPSVRAYQVQFKRWGFPSHFDPLRKNEALVNRVRELWSSNVNNRDLLATLQREGYKVSERKLFRLRHEFGWKYRGSEAGSKDRSQNEEQPNVQENATVDGNDDTPIADAEPSPPAITDEERLKRRRQFQEQSDELRACNKRRRRTRGYGHLGPDPPGPPRYQSETTLDEAKAFLHLDNTHYLEIRETFAAMCRNEGITKKTVTGPDKWHDIKRRLMDNDKHLRRELFGPWNGVEEPVKLLAMDVICQDVTKRMRSSSRKYSLANARSILGFNPQQGRDLRNQFHQILKDDHFLSKVEAGPEHWEELKSRLLESSDEVQRALGGEEGHDFSEENLSQRKEALEHLCRDTMKRYQDELRKTGEYVKLREAGPGPGPATKRPNSSSMDVRHNSRSESTTSNIGVSQTFDEQLDNEQESPGEIQGEDALGAHIAAESAPTVPGLSHDPSAALRFDTTLQQSSHVADFDAYAAQPPAPQAMASMDFAPPNGPSLASPVAALFRLHPNSAIQATKQIYLTTLSSCSLIEIIQGAKNRYGGVEGRDILVRRVEGMMANEAGVETSFSIQSDVELEAYMSYIGSGRLIFTLLLESILL